MVPPSRKLVDDSFWSWCQLICGIQLIFNQERSGQNQPKMRTFLGWSPFQLPWKHGETRSLNQLGGMGFQILRQPHADSQGTSVSILFVRVPFPIIATTGTPWFGIGSIHRLVIITRVIGKLDHIYSITKGHQTVQNDAQVVCQHVWSGRKRAISERTDTGWWFYKGISTILLILDQHTWNVGSSSRHQKKRCLSVISKLSVFLGLEKNTSHEKYPLVN